MEEEGIKELTAGNNLPKQLILSILKIVSPSLSPGTYAN